MFVARKLSGPVGAISPKSLRMALFLGQRRAHGDNHARTGRNVPASPYEPYTEYVDGGLEERRMGEEAFRRATAEFITRTLDGYELRYQLPPRPRGRHRLRFLFIGSRLYSTLAHD